MPTLYVDYENGNDNYGGTSFAPLAQGTNGRITSTTFSSAGASFPNDGSLIGQYLSIFDGTIYAVYNITAWLSATSLTIAQKVGGTALANQASDRQYFIGGRWKTIASGATGVRLLASDTIRVMGSPAPTSLGVNGTWVSQTLANSVLISSTTNATPIRVNCSTTHGYSTGDTVVITGHTVNTNANGTWEITLVDAFSFTLNNSVGNGIGAGTGNVLLRNNTRVRLTSAVTQNIASTGPGRAAWTSAGGANVTTSLNTTTTKEHAQCDQIAIAAAFTTGRAAFWATGTINLSAYQQVSFWIQQVSGTIGLAGAIDLRLCSDTTGTTAVNTISIPNLSVIGRWMPVTVNLGANLGSSIQSIALYVNTDNAAQTFLLSNIIACKASNAADSLTLTSLIGKNTTNETFWGIQSINGTRIMLDGDPGTTPFSTNGRGYYGVSETVTTWKRETVKLGPAATAGTVFNAMFGSGLSMASPFTYSGGWDRTNMSTQNLETWFDGVNGNGAFWSHSGFSFINLNSFAFVRGASLNGTDSLTSSVFDIIALNNMSGTMINISSGAKCTYTIRSMVANTNTQPIIASGGQFARWIIGNFVSNNGALRVGSNNLSLSGLNGQGLLAANSVAPLDGLAQLVKNIVIKDNNNLGAVASTISFDTKLVNCLIEATTDVTVTSNSAGKICSHDHDQVADNHRIFTDGGIIFTAVDQRNTASGFSWKMQPTSTLLKTAEYPLDLSLAKVACGANTLVTIKAWMRRDNAGLTMRLVCKGGQIAGVTSDVTSSVVAVNAWEEKTITFTPTKTGVVEITAEAFGGTTFSGWVDDLTISQA